MAFRILGQDPTTLKGALNVAGRGSLALATGGLTEIPINGKGQTLGAKVGDAATKGVNKLGDLASKLDPTAVGKASTEGVDASQGKIQANSQKLSGLASALQNNATKIQTVAAPQIAGATQIATPEQIVAQQAQQAQIQAAQIARGDEQGARSGQLDLATALQAQASGLGPSLAEAQLQRQNENAIKNQLALAQSQRGINPVLAQRLAAQNIGNLQAEQGQRAAELRIAEQATARGQLGDVLNSTRGLDATLANQQAVLNQGAGLANQAVGADISKFNVANDLVAQTQNVANTTNVNQFNAKAVDEMAKFNADATLKAGVANQAADLQAKGMDQAQIAKLLGLEQASLQAILQSEGVKLGLEQGRNNQSSEVKSKIIGGAISGVAAAAPEISAALSDKNQKTGIKKSDKEINDMLNNLSAFTYKYKNPEMEGAAEGKRYGILAQALEKSAAGKSIVKDTENGKMIDVNQGLGVALAALSAMNKRLAKMEGKRA
jgi:predicted transcriptional regulator